MLNAHCRPAIVSIFNSNIHPAHARMVRELEADAGWTRLAHGWVPFERHPRYKNRTFHAFVHEKRYARTRGPRAHGAGGREHRLSLKP